MPLSRFHSVFAFGIDRASVMTFCHWRQFQNCFIRIHRAHAYRFFECMHSRNIIQTRLTKQTNRHITKHTSKYNLQYVHPIRSSVSLLRLYHSAYSAHCRSSDKDSINENPALGCREVVEGPLDPGIIYVRIIQVSEARMPDGSFDKPAPIMRVVRQVRIN